MTKATTIRRKDADERTAGFKSSARRAYADFSLTILRPAPCPQSPRVQHYSVQRVLPPACSSCRKSQEVITRQEGGRNGVMTECGLAIRWAWITWGVDDVDDPPQPEVR